MREEFYVLFDGEMRILMIFKDHVYQPGSGKEAKWEKKCKYIYVKLPCFGKEKKEAAFRR